MIKLKYLLLLSLLYLAGCSHPIVITARTDKMPAPNATIVQKKAGYYISQADFDQSVTTPGGGGDKITYSPYRDLDAGIYKVLLNVYKDVTKLSSISADEIAKQQVSYVFIPKIKTASSSTGTFTWPATDFEIELTMKAQDNKGNELWSKTLTTSGHAEYDEFKSDFQLSSRRASEAMLKKLQAEITAASKLK